jgi:hypothetical protein
MNKLSTEDFKISKLLCRWYNGGYIFYVVDQTHRMYNTKWFLLWTTSNNTLQCMDINYNKLTTMVGNIDNREAIPVRSRKYVRNLYLLLVLLWI